ncbi:hypothetical protein LOC54_02490 [Acetobacter sp. AN02]|uniref:hypothetical protein n=1 Tax=Acetobacter sp. AN02 TaxID=2894186 RepID=UPI002434492F|nr:hypothetical protein [Acetobacter sp. AN02]MDG6093991.1 hypothetical protein [Acetobacter sp. AN02]
MQVNTVKNAASGSDPTEAVGKKTASDIAPVSDGDASEQESRDTQAQGLQVKTWSSEAPVVNPVQRIDPALGILVTEVYGMDGTVQSQVPTAEALREYQLFGTANGQKI